MAGTHGFTVENIADAGPESISPNRMTIIDVWVQLPSVVADASMHQRSPTPHYNLHKINPVGIALKASENLHANDHIFGAGP